MTGTSSPSETPSCGLTTPHEHSSHDDPIDCVLVHRGMGWVTCESHGRNPCPQDDGAPGVSNRVAAREGASRVQERAPSAGHRAPRVVVLLIPDQDYAWEVLGAASDQAGIARALMVNVDHPESVAALFRSECELCGLTPDACVCPDGPLDVVQEADRG